MSVKVRYFAALLIVFGFLMAEKFEFPTGSRKPASLGPGPFQNQAALCEQHKTLQSRKYFQKMLAEPSNRIGFKNPHRGLNLNLLPHGLGDLYPTGLCWWISRFERAATYLTYYSQNKPKPTGREAQDIFKQIIDMKEIIEIPGYTALTEFTKDYREELILELERWQRWDIPNGIKRTVDWRDERSNTYNSDMKSQIDEIYRLTQERSLLPAIFLQFPGVSAHSWLVLNAEKHFDSEGKPRSGKYVQDGYTFKVIDSQENEMSPETFIKFTDTRAGLPAVHGYKTFAIYVDWMDDLDQIEKAVNASCGIRVPLMH